MKAVTLTSKHELHALGQCEEMASEGVLHVCGRGAAHSWAGMGGGEHRGPALNGVGNTGASKSGSRSLPRLGGSKLGR